MRYLTRPAHGAPFHPPAPSHRPLAKQGKGCPRIGLCPVGRTVFPTAPRSPLHPPGERRHDVPFCREDAKTKMSGLGVSLFD
jgi:hypothetical protein